MLFLVQLRYLTASVTKNVCEPLLISLINHLLTCVSKHYSVMNIDDALY